MGLIYKYTPIGGNAKAGKPFKEAIQDKVKKIDPERRALERLIKKQLKEFGDKWGGIASLDSYIEQEGKKKPKKIFRVFILLDPSKIRKEAQ